MYGFMLDAVPISLSNSRLRLFCIALQGSRALEQLDGNKLKGKLLTPDKFLWLYNFTGRMSWQPQAVARST